MTDTNTLMPTDAVFASLRRLYINLISGGVRDTASAKQIAEGLLAPAIDKLERLARGQASSEAQPVAALAGMAPVAWRLHPFDYGIGSEGVYAITQFIQQRHAWVNKGWMPNPLYTAAQVQAMHAQRVVECESPVQQAQNSSVPAREPLTAEQLSKELMALIGRLFDARIGQACSSCEAGTYQADSNGYSQFHRCNKCHYVPIWGEDGREFGIPAAKKGGQHAD